MIRTAMTDPSAGNVDQESGAPAAVAEHAPGVAAERRRTTRPGPLNTLARALRVHQWVKNILVFVPLVTAHRVTEPGLLLQALTAFAAFCLAASSAYLVNDLLDLPADRAHPRKRHRPLAAGDLHPRGGAGLALLLLLGAAAVCLVLPPLFGAVLALYYVLTLAYSLYLKRKLLVDVYALGALYTLRVLAGGAATGIVVSAWLLAFSMFLFLSLALVKRFAELRAMEPGAPKQAAGRGYLASDVQAIGSLGTASAFMCVLVLALYINSPQVGPLYREPAVLWLLCPLLMYWVSRVWVIAYRGQMDADPVVFALTDRVSYLVGLAAAAVIVVASVGWPF